MEVENLFEVDENGREINIYRMFDCQLIGDDLFYPNCRILSCDAEVINPIMENIMSLNKLKKRQNKYEINNKATSIFTTPVFYFIYNTDNYYHFVYDTLPYLITYRYLKSKISTIKLLMNYPNFESKKFYKFVEEFLDILKISKDDVVIADKNILYSEIFFSSSYTHGVDSNLPPRFEVYDFLKEIVSLVEKNSKNKIYPEKIYISRRTWLNKELDNIGTNYTNKRICENESDLVFYLKGLGFEEIFAENLSIIEKVELFSNAKYIIGLIGGGLTNVLFSRPETKLLCLVSPTFMEVNQRFIYSLNRVDVKYFFDARHVEVGEFKKYMRATNGEIVGEITEVFDDHIKLSYTERFVAGWNSQIKLKEIILKKSDIIKLDDGLNSPFTIDLEKLKYMIRI